MSIVIVVVVDSFCVVDDCVALAVVVVGVVVVCALYVGLVGVCMFRSVSFHVGCAQ